jgi:D-alanyl-D-alanine carboxypeptidase/D-alanyl-D-alanine-endopeptidase (penicillin-binding protein 4)
MNKRAKKFLAVLLLLGLPAVTLPAQDFPARAEALLSTGPFCGAQVAAVFVSTDGAVQYSLNAGLPLVPASTAKLATSAAALTRLTPEFRFTTTFLMANKDLGREKLSVLVWRGTGDPSISGRGRASMDEIFEVWAASLAALGVNKVQRLVLDQRYFDGPAVHPSWPAGEYAYWYEAQTSPISFNDNCTDMEFRPAAKAGRRPEIVLTPDLGYLKIKNRAVTGAPDSPFTLDYSRDPGTNTVRFTGSIPAGRSRRDYVAVHAPARFAAEALRRAWKKKGIKVAKILYWDRAGLKEEELRPAFAWNSEPLEKLIQVVNTNSQNLYAEQILKALGKEAGGMGSFAGGIGMVENFLAGIGLAGEQYHLVDGSGLSEDNRFTAGGLVKLLLHMQGTPLFPVYYDSLATAKNRMKADPVLAAGMRLKRGTVGPARNLAGYLHSASGRLYAFAVLVNAPGLDRSAVDDGLDELCLSAARLFP